jgi:hypothetical protein
LNKPLSIDPAVLRRLRSLPKNAKVECLLALTELVEVFGRPHLHTGLAIRKLGSSVFECRGNLEWRFIFQDRPTELFVCFLGNHDEVKSLLHSAKFH